MDTPKDEVSTVTLRVVPVNNGGPATNDEPWKEFEGEEFRVGDAVLTTAARKALHSSSFADQEGKAYPTPDKRHARTAIVYFLRFGVRKYKGAKRKSVAGRILAAAKRFGIKVSDETRKRMMGDSATVAELALDSPTRALTRYRRNFRKQYGIDAIMNDAYLRSKYEAWGIELMKRRCK